MALNKEEVIKKIYHDPSNPAGFAGKKQLYEEAKKFDSSITKGDINHFLEGDRVYTLHRPRRIHFKRAKCFAAGYGTDYHFDLADMQKVARNNNSFKYILVGVDVLSKMLYAEGVKSKQKRNMIEAFEAILNRMPMVPQRIFTDRGKEFILTETDEKGGKSNYFKEKGIAKHWSSTKTVKASLAERSIRNLKSRLYKFFSQKQTLKWIEILPKLVNSINHSYCRVIGMRPIDVNFSNAQTVWEKIYGKNFFKKAKLKSKLKKGDTVRMANYKEVFDRGYLPNWSDEIIEVDSVKKGRPDTYRVKDERGEPFTGQFYAEDLGKTRKDKQTTYRIEKVAGKRTIEGKKQIKVKFIGYPNFEWINESDIVM